MLPVLFSLAILAQATQKSPAQTQPPAAPTAHAEPTGAPAYPGLVKEPELDLGKIKSTEIQRFKITLLNTASTPITIEGISAPCGCTAVAPIRKVLEPNEALEVPISFDPHGYWGPLTRRVDIRTSDPSKPLLIWNFKSDIQSATIPQPKGVYLTVDEGAATPSTATFRFVQTTTAIKPKTLRFETTSTPTPALTWRLEGGEVKGTLILDPSKLSATQMAEERAQGRSSKLILTLADGSTDWISVNWFIQPAIRVFPLRADFAGQPGLVMEQKIALSSTTPFKILSAKSSLPAIKVLLPTFEQPQTAFVIQVRAEGLPAGQHNGKVTLAIDSPKVKELTIPITAIIK